MSALTAAIQQSFVAHEHEQPVISPHRPLGRHQLGGLAVFAQSVATVAPAVAMVAFPTMLLRSGHPLESLLLAIVAMIGMCLIARCLAELTARLSASGGVYSFVVRGLGPVPGAVVAVSLLVKYVGSAGMSVYQVSRAVELIAAATGWPLPSASVTGLVPAMIIVGIAVLIFITVTAGVRIVALALLVIETCSLVFMIVMIIVPGATIGTGPLAPTSGHVVYLAVTFIVFALAGFESATFLGPETRRGLTTVTKVVWLTPVLCGGLLLFAGLATLTGRTDAMVNAYLHGTAAGASVALVVAVNLAMTCSWLGSATASANAISRVVYTLGLEHVLPRRWGRVQPRLRTPVRAAAVCTTAVAALAVTVVVVGPLWPDLVANIRGGVRVAVLTFYLGVVVAMVSVLVRIHEMTRRVLVMAALTTPVLMAMLVAVLAGELEQRPVATVITCVVLGATGPAWIQLRRRRSRPLRVGVFDRPESADALPGGARVHRTADGELILAGRRPGTSAGSLAGSDGPT